MSRSTSKRPGSLPKLSQRKAALLAGGAAFLTCRCDQYTGKAVLMVSRETSVDLGGASPSLVVVVVASAVAIMAALVSLCWVV
jgi:hypothetical protein